MDWTSCLDQGVATLRCIPILIKNLVNAALVLAGVTALVIIIYSGIKFITSRGDTQAVADARKSLTFAIIGLVVIFLSFFIIALLSKTTGVDQIQNPSI